MAKTNGDTARSYFKTFSKYGFVAYSPKYDCYAVFYNEELPDDMIRWSKCFGLAYIELGLVKDYKTINLRESTPDIFALYFSCPDAVLESCEIKKAEDIIEYCSIPFYNARKKAERILDLNYASKTTLDESLLKSFDTFINFFKRK